MSLTSCKVDQKITLYDNGVGDDHSICKAEAKWTASQDDFRVGQTYKFIFTGVHTHDGKLPHIGCPNNESWSLKCSYVATDTDVRDKPNDYFSISIRGDNTMEITCIKNTGGYVFISWNGINPDNDQYQSYFDSPTSENALP
jgi:hypothetical protein